MLIYGSEFMFRDLSTNHTGARRTSDWYSGNKHSQIWLDNNKSDNRWIVYLAKRVSFACDWYKVETNLEGKDSIQFDFHSFDRLPANAIHLGTDGF